MTGAIRSRWLLALACLSVILLAAFVRLSGTGWDGGSGLHPDERHMIFSLSETLRQLVEGRGMTWGELWFGTGLSPLDPRHGGRLYVYGELPHLAMSLLSHALGVKGWADMLALTRTASAVLDAYTCLAVFVLTMSVTRQPAAALAASIFYAAAPLALQHANFFTVDVWLAASAAWCLVATTLLALAPPQGRALMWAALAGGLAAVALACKLPGALLSLGIAIAVFVGFRRHRSMRRALLELAVAALSFLFTFRLASPFSFEGPGFFALMPSQAMIAGYLEAARLAGSPEFPPNWQWMGGYGPMHALRDIAVMAIGPVLAAAVLAGVPAMRRAGGTLWMPTAFVTLCFCAYAVFGSPPVLRYMLPALPGLCVTAGAALGRSWQTTRGRAVFFGVLACALYWGSGMAALHSYLPNSRVAASQWLWENTVPGTVVAHESVWDDRLPLPIRMGDGQNWTWPEDHGQFSFVNLDVEAPDTPVKAARIAERLERADLLVLSSERLRQPIQALPARFPMMSAFYSMLADGRLCFVPLYRHHSTYPLPGLPLDDAWVQESWSVYDHPSVEIYRKSTCFLKTDIETQLLQAFDSGS